MTGFHPHQPDICKVDISNEILSLAFGIVWLGFSLASGWAKKRSWSIGLQTVGFIFAGLQAYYAGIYGLVLLIIFNILRNIIFYQADKHIWARSKWWSVSFISLSTILYILITPMVTVWVYIPLFARVLGIFGYANLDNFVAKNGI